ncbi:efflux RND transporter periplasmic adaptor subunit [Desulfospira joergensenii]|uniref:efflux RND transporter periplasmic adaptor subunit n=1 Tax=Desulfospira joergensenii TaxID=53329 RepID=UPI0004831F73|nr:efflux RND transporter periplasmic adaptor subunit [Desulfospira joergensenii]
MRNFVKIVLPLCLILGGAFGFKYFKSKEVKVTRKPPQKHVALVETLQMEPATHETFIHAMGTVLADKEIILKARVSGEVIWVSPKFVQGGLIREGEILLRLDDSDYKLEVDKARNSLNKALADLEIEKGQQLIAREELKLITQISPEGVGPTDLALRKPQLAQARAAVASARNDLEKAGLDLKRTRIRVPFNALILEKNVDLGSLVASQGALTTLVDVTKYRVEAQLPLDRLPLLKVDETQGSPARIRSQYADHEWEGRVVRITGKTTGQSRLAGVIIEVPDPLGLKGDSRQKLLLDDHVEIRITGQTVENVYALPRSLVRENNTLWIYNSGHLKIRPADIVWKEKDRVFIRSGIHPGDRVIASDLPVPVQGMELALTPGEGS